MITDTEHTITETETAATNTEVPLNLTEQQSEFKQKLLDAKARIAKEIQEVAIDFDFQKPAEADQLDGLTKLVQKRLVLGDALSVIPETDDTDIKNVTIDSLYADTVEMGFSDFIETGALTNGENIVDTLENSQGKEFLQNIVALLKIIGIQDSGANELDAGKIITQKLSSSDIAFLRKHNLLEKMINAINQPQFMANLEQDYVDVLSNSKPKLAEVRDEQKAEKTAEAEERLRAEAENMKKLFQEQFNNLLLSSTSEFSFNPWAYQTPDGRVNGFKAEAKVHVMMAAIDALKMAKIIPMGIVSSDGSFKQELIKESMASGQKSGSEVVGPVTIIYSDYNVLGKIRLDDPDSNATVDVDLFKIDHTAYNTNAETFTFNLNTESI